MTSQPLDHVARLPVRAVWDGVTARAVDGERITMALVELEADAVVPEHRHENEQLGMLIRGRLTFTVGDTARDLEPGGTWCIPSDVPHSVRVGPDGATVVDIFAPVRADWTAIPREQPRPPRWPPTAEGDGT